MGALYDMRAFYRWLDEANEQEMLKRRDLLVKLLPSLSEEEVISEARHLLKLIERELVARTMK